jgi:hypothetical protein
VRVPGVHVNLTDWAARWAVPPQAMAELAALQIHATGQLSRNIESESALQSLVRLEGANKGIHLWRNNVGVLKDKNGRPVRYGLANDSSEVNEVIKSGDLIGIEKVLITDAHVGTVLGRFVSRDCKPPGWEYTGTPREVAQLQWATLINSMGGNARMVNSEGSL